jgi:hypothetical protein
MRKLILLSLLLVALCGCEENKQQQQVGFLSDYSRLEQGGLMTFNNEPSPEILGKYSKFIVDPVEIYFYDDSKGRKTRLNDSDIVNLKDCLRQSIVMGLSGRYQIVSEPGDGVARIKVALTNIKQASVIRKLIPSAKVSGQGLETVAIEAEIVDSRTDEQLGAAIETHAGIKRALYGRTRPKDVKMAVNEWTWKLRNSVDQAHGYLSRCQAQ